MYGEDTLNNIRELYSLYLDGKIKGPETHEVHPNLLIDSRENYLYFTLPCCLNFQRNSPAMWKSALNTFEDADTNYLFFPEKVVGKQREEVQRDLIKHKLALQHNKHVDIWIRISKTLAKHYNNNPREILKEGNFDVKQIIQILQEDKKPLFPYLGGIKLSNYWLFILSRFTNVRLENVEEISIIPDTHVIKSTVRLGLAQLGVKSTEVERIWRVILKEVNISPVDMHPTLWAWSRQNFLPDVGLSGDSSPRQLELLESIDFG
jgi:hypothetical protein